MNKDIPVVYLDRSAYDPIVNNPNGIVITTIDGSNVEICVKNTISSSEKKSKKKQVVTRTYPGEIYTNPTSGLHKYLESGYTVVMVNPFDLPNGRKGNEYILEKEEDDDD